MGAATPPLDLTILLEKFQGNAYPAMLDELGRHVGVSAASLRRLALGWAPIVTFKKGPNFQGWWVIPERDADGDPIGLSLRSQSDMKVMYPGSKHGLIYEVNPNHSRGEKGYNAGAHNWVRTMDAGVLCAVCQKPDGCLLSAENPADPKAVVCRVEKSPRPLKFGWLHIRKAEGNLKQTPALADHGGPVLVVEGMTDTATAMDLGFDAVGRPSDLACMDFLCKLLPGRTVIVVGENDKKPDGKHPGRVGAETTYGALIRAGVGDVRIVMPPEHIKDLRVWRTKYGLTREQFLAHAEKSGERPAVPAAARPDGRSQRDAVSALLGSDTLSHDSTDTAFATFISSTAGPSPICRRTTAPVQESAYALHVRHVAFRAGLTLSEAALIEVVQQQAARAVFDGPQRPVFVRHGVHDGAIYIDLADDSGSAVAITPDGYRVVANPPVLFRRVSGAQELPRPDDGGTFEEFLDLVGLTHSADRILLTSWLVGALHPRGPYPILSLAASQGSGKSLLAEFLIGLLDPCDVPLMALTENERDLSVIARDLRVLGFDNVSGLSPALSDSLCRLVSGAGLRDRRLYSQNETVTFRGCRPIVMTSIGEVLSRPDLRQRSITISLAPIDRTRRRTEADLRAEFLRIRPGVLGAMFKAAATGLANLPTTQLRSSLRMADFSAFITAAEPSLPWKPGEFQAAYNADQQAADETAVEDSPVGSAVIRFMAGKTEWTGAVGDLLPHIDTAATSVNRGRLDFPKTAKGLSDSLERVRPALQASGVELVRMERTHSGRRIMLKRIAAAE
jgi:hypothetical protein